MLTKWTGFIEGKQNNLTKPWRAFWRKRRYKWAFQQSTSLYTFLKLTIKHECIKPILFAVFTDHAVRKQIFRFLCLKCPCSETWNCKIGHFIFIQIHVEKVTSYKRLSRSHTHSQSQHTLTHTCAHSQHTEHRLYSHTRCINITHTWIHYTHHNNFDISVSQHVHDSFTSHNMKHDTSAALKELVGFGGKLMSVPIGGKLYAICVNAVRISPWYIAPMNKRV